jgi:hypothetical protein
MKVFVADLAFLRGNMGLLGEELRPPSPCLSIIANQAIVLITV